MKVKKILVIVIFITLFFSGKAVYAGDPISEGMPGIEEVISEDYNDYEYITKYRENYSIDANTGTFNIVDSALNKITNILFSLQRALVEAVIFLFDNVFSFSSYDLFNTLIEQFIGNMYKSTFGKVAGLILAFLGLYFFIKTIQQRQSEFFTQLVKTVLIIAIAIMYFTNPLLFAKAIDDISNGITKTIISTADKKEIKNYLDAIADTKRQKEMADKVIITIIANDLWEEYIHKPWRIMEFGDNEIADQWQDRILSEDKGSDERKEVIEELEDESGIKTESMVVERLGFMLMYFIPLIINILLMCLFCIFIIGVQFLIVFVFILGIFVFMLALIPSIGGEILKKWAATLGVLAGMKVVLAFVLMLMIAFNQAVFTAMSEDGWIYALLIQLVLYFAIYMYRGKIIGIFSSAREVIANPVESFKNLKRTGSTDPYRNRGNGGLLPRRNPRNVRGIGSVVSYLGKNRKEYKAAKNERQKLIEGKEKEHNEKVERQKARKHLNNKYKFFKKKRDAYFSGKSKNRVGKKGLQISNMVDKRIANKQEAFTDKEVDGIVSRRKNAKEYLQKRRMREGEHTIVKYTEPLPEIKEVKKKKGFKRFNPVNRRNRRRKD